MKKIIMSAVFAAFMSTLVYAKPPVVAQYFGIWTEKGQQWEQKFRDDTPFDKLNRLYVSFGKIVKTADGHFTLDFDGDVRHAQAIIDRMRQVNPKADVMLTIGADQESFVSAAKDPQFPSNVLKFLTRYGFNGLDVDWEMGLNKTSLNQLITNLYTTLHGNGMKLTLDVWPFMNPAYDIPVLKSNLDQINIMSYGSSLNLDYSANMYIDAGFPAYKIIGGVETESSYPGGVDTLTEHGSIVAKATFAKEHHLAGMMGWRLDNDYAPSEHPEWPTYEGALALWDVMINF